MKVGFVGLGLMGLPMARRVINAGFDLYIWNRDSRKCQQLAHEGAIITSSPKDLARQVDVILLCVTDEYAVEAILFGSNGVLEANKPQQIIVDHSTICPVMVKTIANKIKYAGMAYIDAPITGSVSGAVNGTLVVFAGGDSESIEKVRPVLSAYSKRVNHMGANGYGQATKVCNQTVLLNMIFAIFEMVNLAKQQGLDTDKLLSVFEDSLFDCKAWRIYSQAVIFGGEQKLAPIKNVMKDMRYIQKVGKLTNSPIFLTEKTSKLVDGLISKGMGDQDIIELMQLYDVNSHG